MPARRGEAKAGRNQGREGALSPQGLGTRASQVTAPGGVSSVGAAEHAPGCRHRRKFPSCLCMSLSFTRGCSLSLLGSCRLLRQRRARARVPALSRRARPGPRWGGALGSPGPGSLASGATWPRRPALFIKEGEKARVERALPALPLLRPQFHPSLRCQERWVPVEQTGEKAHSHRSIRGMGIRLLPLPPPLAFWVF